MKQGSRAIKTPALGGGAILGVMRRVENIIRNNKLLCYDKHDPTIAQIEQILNQAKISYARVIILSLMIKSSALTLAIIANISPPCFNTHAVPKSKI